MVPLLSSVAGLVESGAGYGPVRLVYASAH